MQTSPKPILENPYQPTSITKIKNHDKTDSFPAVKPHYFSRVGSWTKNKHFINCLFFFVGLLLTKVGHSNCVTSTMDIAFEMQN
jgi:hypothetical protein